MYNRYMNKNIAYAKLRTELAKYADDRYREFVERGTPGEKRPFLGIRIPQIREIVRKIPREDYVAILEEEPMVFEEVIARGFIIARLPYVEMLKYFDSQVDYTDSWGTCDTFVAALRPAVKGHRAEFLDAKIESLLSDPREFAVRVGLVALLDFYVDFDYLALIFDRVDRLAAREEYYIRMALAWLVAECFIKFPEETLGYLQVSKLPKWTFNKAISKMCDSLRVEPEMKDYLRTLRRK